MIAIIYCFTNREVIHVLKSHYQRYRLQHSTGDTLRRGSRAASVFYQKNGQVARASATPADARLPHFPPDEEPDRVPSPASLSFPVLIMVAVAVAQHLVRSPRSVVPHSTAP